MDGSENTHQRQSTLEIVLLISSPTGILNWKNWKHFLRLPHWKQRELRYQYTQDLSYITIIKRRDFKFLTSALVQEGFSYRWCFPFKFVFDNGKGNHKIIIRSVKEMEASLSKFRKLLHFDRSFHPNLKYLHSNS